MIWALLFGLLFSVFGGGAPSILHGSDKLIKKYVQDKARQDELLYLIHESEKEQKILLADYKSFSKDMNQLLQSRETKEDYFALTINKLKCQSEKSNWVNKNLAIQSRELITENEWIQISAEYKTGIQTMTDVWEKDKRIVKNHFNKLEQSILKNVPEESRSSLMITNLNQVESSILSFLKVYKKEIENDKSMLYQYQVNIKDIEFMQSQHAMQFESLVHDYVDMYYSIVKNTNKQEWSKINKRLRLPF